MNEIKKINQEIALDDQSFKVAFIPAKIDFSGYEAMEKAIDQIAEEYAGWEVKPEILKESKAARTQLNKLKKGINDVKIDIVKQADAPIIKFKNDIKELLDKIDQTSSSISKGIKELEAKEKKDRHEQRLKLISKLATASGIDPSRIEFNARWDLKSTTHDEIKSGVETQIQTLVAKDYEFGENVKAVQLEADTLGLPADHWIDLLRADASLSGVLKAMKDYKKELVEIAGKEKEAKKKRQAELKKQRNHVIDPETGEIKEKLTTFSMTFYGVTDYQIEQLSSYLKDMGIKFGNVKKR